ncbi:hypothetical protein BO83DRAFT_375750 [Aspergillus eucalypticola CBS 122712]|uniref:CWH43-like N-terminal domain-containing protein n=1 Tax=Aspergillus eucalypticola (strain CBS 122712 / IBT 29274) TaxID=1448314 RepID=A0A317W3I0_ASPEC|nr:uncharacterized protein BO83DRAFT_375750 [Aspergillus eucalypticola CBS 122712]PWY79807.1 hypothetical protein BO83DRAFT_375750 [Aspergillus eucalypticola CBS 122712]
MIISFLLRCHDSIWAFLHATILNIPPSRLYIFPTLAGSVWFLTLASLLLTWLARGMPVYPGQSNPHVAFISDIASFELKPLFLIGASMTAVGFIFTVAAVHVMRYEPGFALVKCPVISEETSNNQGNSNTYTQASDHNHRNVHNHITGGGHNEGEEEDDDDDEEDQETTRTLKVISLLSILAAGTASTALILLGVMDTFRYKFAHHIFLRICFGCLAIQSAGTAIVYSTEVLSFVSYLYHWGVWGNDWGRKRSNRVRIFASLSTILILIQLFLGVAFISLTIPEDANDYRTAGILEWIIAFLGTIYLWLFCGFFDRTSFEGYVPSILYNATPHGKFLGRPAVPGVGVAEAESSYNPADDTLDVDPERAPLLPQSQSQSQGGLGTRYT